MSRRVGDVVSLGGGNGVGVDLLSVDASAVEVQIGYGVGLTTCSTESSGVGSAVGKGLGKDVTAVGNEVGSDDAIVGSGFGAEVGRRVGWVGDDAMDCSTGRSQVGLKAALKVGTWAGELVESLVAGGLPGRLRRWLHAGLHSRFRRRLS